MKTKISQAIYPKIIGIFMLLIFLCTKSASCQNTNYLFQPTNEKGTIELKLGPEIVKTQNVFFRPEILLKNGRAMGNIFGKKITIILDKTNDKALKQTMKGSVLEAKYSYVIITESNGIYACNIFIDNTLYQIRNIGKEVYQLREINQNEFKEGCNTKKESNNEGDAGPCTTTDPADFIDVMVLYSIDAREGAGGTDQITSEIFLALEETNLIYSNSAIDQRLRLVHIAELNYTGSGNTYDELLQVSDPSDGVLDNIHTLRNTYFADLVSVIVETDNNNYCGWGNTNNNRASMNSARAFSVIKRSCATGNYSFGHELGHNMGAHHNCEQTSETSHNDYNHGLAHLKADGNEVRTVMSYKNCSTCNSFRLPYMSNPNINFPGLTASTGSTGTGCTADVHRVLNETALAVANFQCHSSNVGNVWMKDTWADTGLEPDPNTVGQNMWLSPYIWIRNQRDNTFAHQHQHENPELGSSNWVYVKLHNGGVATSGNLELWVANASISLSWPAEWTRIANLPVNIGASTSTIQEFEWANLPGEGHYCMIARWVSATDPMHTIETSDINSNTIQNNNIIWRNLNIVDLQGDQGDISFNFNPRLASQIEIVFKTDAIYKPYLPKGELYIQFDPIVGNSIPKKGKGYVKVSDNLLRITSSKQALIPIQPKLITKLPYEKNSSATAKLIFRAKKAPNARFWLDVNHLVKEKRIGGIGYEINNEKR